jgi:hypothetical protein
MDPPKTMAIDTGSMKAPIPADPSIAQAITAREPTRPITVAISIIREPL